MNHPKPSDLKAVNPSDNPPVCRPWTVDGPIPSGIVLPGDEPLQVEDLGDGSLIVKNAYQRDYGYFSMRSPYPAEEVKPKRVLIVQTDEGERVIDLSNYTTVPFGPDVKKEEVTSAEIAKADFAKSDSR